MLATPSRSPTATHLVDRRPPLHRHAGLCLRLCVRPAARARSTALRGGPELSTRTWSCCGRAGRAARGARRDCRHRPGRPGFQGRGLDLVERQLVAPEAARDAGRMRLPRLASTRCQFPAATPSSSGSVEPGAAQRVEQRRQPGDVAHRGRPCRRRSRSRARRMPSPATSAMWRGVLGDQRQRRVGGVLAVAAGTRRRS